MHGYCMLYIIKCVDNQNIKIYIILIIVYMYYTYISHNNVNIM